jgi:hypothetical protein
MVRVKPTFLGLPFRYGAGRTGNGRVFASYDERSDGVVTLNAQVTSLAIRNICTSALRSIAATKVRILFP